MILSRRSLLIGSAACVAAQSLRAAEHDMVIVSGPAFGADWRVLIGAQADAGAVAAQMMAVIRSVNDTLSPFHPESEISRFNAAQTTALFAVSEPVLATIREARRVHDLSGGAFDPTFGGVSGRFGFSPIRQAPAGRFADLAIAAGGLRKAAPDQTLDLCGIAKGYALDQAVAALMWLGHQRFLIEMGGEVRGMGAHPDGRDWAVGVEHPVASSSAVWHRVALHGEAMATSGDRVNSYASGARRYGHIIDPLRHAPADTPLTSVSVFAPAAMTADALATALFALGPEAGPELAERAGIAALFLIRDGAALREIMTAGYADRVLA